MTQTGQTGAGRPGLAAGRSQPFLERRSFGAGDGRRPRAPAGCAGTAVPAFDLVRSRFARVDPASAGVVRRLSGDCAADAHLRPGGNCRHRREKPQRTRPVAVAAHVDGGAHRGNRRNRSRCDRRGRAHAGTRPHVARQRGAPDRKHGRQSGAPPGAAAEQRCHSGQIVAPLSGGSRDRRRRTGEKGVPRQQAAPRHSAFTGRIPRRTCGSLPEHCEASRNSMPPRAAMAC